MPLGAVGMKLAFMSLITGVDFVCLPVTDLDRAVAFYTEVLGLPERARWGSRKAVEVQAGNLTLVLWDPEDFGMQRHGSGPVALHTDDYEAAKAALEAAGVTFLTDTIDSGVCFQGIFQDPDGNPLTLHHRYAPTGA